MSTHQQARKLPSEKKFKVNKSGENWLMSFIIQISHFVRILIFWLVDLHRVTLGCDETTSLTSLSWCKFNTPLTFHHGLGRLKVLTIYPKQTSILLLMMQFLKTPRKQLLAEYSFWKVRLRIFNSLFTLVELCFCVLSTVSFDYRVRVFLDIFCKKKMINLLLTLKRIKFKINILSGLPSI